MSTIEKMEIQAIRSFGPESQDVQKITFFKPLTLILGPNGTGKTTIIECLRYATTGDMPPGGNKNGAFIHDPKLAREREIKGQVKLLIRDVTGVPCTVVRSVMAKTKDAKGEKIEMKTMDGVISRLRPDGEKNSITQRCADLNREMITALGVSKAVLDNVIFCHQEDSNWPLGEGKTLKIKFDSIFDSTRYTKVLEELKKIQSTQMADLRLCKGELKHLKEQKEKAQRLQADVEDLKAKLAASESKVEEVETELTPIKTRLEQIGEHSNAIYKLQSQKQKCETQRDQIEKMMKDLKKNIKSPYKGTVNQLERELEEFASNLEDKRDQIETSEKQQAGFTEELEKMAKEKNKLLVAVGKLEQEAETNKVNIKKRNKKVTQLAEEYDFEGFETASTIDEKDCDRFLSLLNDKLIESMNDAKTKKMSFEEEEKKIQGKIDTLRENKTKLQHSEKIKRDTMEKNKKEIQDINKKLRHMASSADKLGKIETDLKRVENDLVEHESSMNGDEMKKEIDEQERKKRQIEADFGKLDAEMNRLHKQSEAQTQLNMLKADQEEKLSSINRLQSIHEENIIGLLGHMPVDDLRLSIETYKSNQSDSVRKCNSDLGALKTKLTTKEAEKVEASNQVRQKERELKEKEDQIYDICEDREFEEELGEVQRNLTQAQEEKGSLLGADHMIKKYIRGLEKNNPNCPLCLRDFEREQEVRELILKLEEARRKVPQNMRKAEQEMERQQTKYDNLMQLKPVRESVTVMKEQDIPTQKSKAKKLEEEIKKIKQSMEDKEEELMSKESDLEIVNGMHSDIVLMDRYKGDVRELERKIASQSAMLSGNGSNRSIKVVIAEKEKKQLEIDTISRALNHKRDKLSEFQDHTQKLRFKVNALKEEKLNIEGELQRKIQLENTKATLTSDNSNFERDIEESRSQIQPLEGQIKKVLKEKEDLTFKKEEMLSHARELSEVIKGNATTVKSINQEILNYIKSGNQGKQNECKERKARLDQKQTRLENEQQEVNDKINTLRKDIATQQVKERELKDSLQLFKKEDEIKKLMVDINDLSERLKEFDVKNLERERQNLIAQEKTLTLELHRASGRQQGYKEEIRSKKKELQEPMYKDADRKYSDEVIKSKTMEIANRDLNKYYRAMDQAIMRYHNAKMEEINRIILHLWRTTYKGNDIDTIEIRSEGDDGEIKARRNYNYRVVMIKNGVVIDMRGRCSAGQKVLASLIIRLALAETFCVNCGVLALDEPTTNLDRENIESLAMALLEIIKDRFSIRHFQLVVITHDTDFVELLGRANHVDQYVEVSKNDEGMSRLCMRRVETLNK